MTVVYIGANTTAGLRNRGTAVDLLGGALAHMTSVKPDALPSGPCDTSNECASAVDQGQPVVVCGWSSDRTFGLLLQTSPGGTVSELAAEMRKMRPDLVRG